MIEWVYRDAFVVVPDEELWSSVEHRCVPIGGPALLIAVHDGVLTWLSEKGLFRARVDDALHWDATIATRTVVPRACVDDVRRRT